MNTYSCTPSTTHTPTSLSPSSNTRRGTRNPSSRTGRRGPATPGPTIRLPMPRRRPSSSSRLTKTAPVRCRSCAHRGPTTTRAGRSRSSRPCRSCCRAGGNRSTVPSSGCSCPQRNAGCAGAEKSSVPTAHSSGRSRPCTTCERALRATRSGTVSHQFQQVLTRVSSTSGQGRDGVPETGDRTSHRLDHGRCLIRPDRLHRAPHRRVRDAARCADAVRLRVQVRLCRDAWHRGRSADACTTCSDHGSFDKAGYPAACLSEGKFADSNPQ